MIKKILLMFIFSLMLFGCSSKLSLKEIKKIMSENDYVIIDVRTKEEYDAYHLSEAINVPYDELTDDLSKDKIIFVYCKSGNRSKVAYNLLTGFGYKVYDLGAIDSISLPKESTMTTKPSR